MQIRVTPPSEDVPEIDLMGIYKDVTDMILRGYEVSFTVAEKQYYLVCNNSCYLALDLNSVVTVGKDLFPFLKDFLRCVLPLRTINTISYSRCNLVLTIGAPTMFKQKVHNLRLPEEIYPSTLPYTPSAVLGEIFGATLEIRPYGVNKPGYLVRLDGTEQQLPPAVIARLIHDEELSRSLVMSKLK